MMERWEWICLRVGDAIFGWTLSLPRDVTIVVVGVLLAAVLLIVRRITTDQGQLLQIENDERRLRELIRNARAEGDQERTARHWRVRRLVATHRVRAEAIAMLVSVVVLAIIIQWGLKRLEYLPIRANQDTQFAARFPSSMIGEVVHLAPIEHVTAVNGWVHFVDPTFDAELSIGKAEWTLRFGDSKEPFRLTVRHRDQSASHSILVGSPRYEPPIQSHDGGVETEIMLQPYIPLGLLPPHIWPGIPGWLLLLSLVTGSAFWIGKRRHGQKGQ